MKSLSDIALRVEDTSSKLRMLLMADICHDVNAWEKFVEIATDIIYNASEVKNASAVTMINDLLHVAYGKEVEVTPLKMSQRQIDKVADAFNDFIEGHKLYILPTYRSWDR